MFLIFTPIFYANRKPHIGHNYTLYISTYINKFHKCLGSSSYIISGTDEHGDKIYKDFQENHKDIKNFADFISHKRNIFLENLFKKFQITSIFGTHSLSHISFVNKITKQLIQSKYIYTGEYSGIYYKNTCEYINQLEYEKLDQSDKEKTYTLKEQGYYLKFSADNKEKIKQNLLVTEKYKEFAHQIIDNGKDLFITRISTDENKIHSCPFIQENKIDYVFYVWYDAILYYINILILYNRSVTQSIIVIGKDILSFHCLLLQNLCLIMFGYMPFQIVVHGIITTNELKVSKSKHNEEETNEILSQYGELVYSYLLSKPFHEDTELKEDGIVSYKNYIENNVRNAYKRVFGLLPKYESFYNKHHYSLLNENLIGSGLYGACEKVLFELNEMFSKPENGIIYKKLVHIASLLNENIDKNKLWDAQESKIYEFTECLNTCKLMLLMEYILCVPGVEEIFKTLEEPIFGELAKLPKFNNKIINKKIDINIFNLQI
ncbi:Methionine--tRNA ligase [bacterium AB1]|nr:Methionine--tRNA ligase [bacterium AB1]